MSGVDLTTEEERLRSLYLWARGLLDPEFRGHVSPKWDGGIDPYTGRKFQPVWKKGREAAARRGITPEQQVEALISLAGQGGLPCDPPTPNLLGSEIVLSEAARLARTRHEESRSIQDSAAVTQAIELRARSADIPRMDGQ